MITSSVTPWLAHERSFEFRRTHVRFSTAHDLFSSAALDVGTSRLLRVLGKSALLTVERGRPLRVLDLGCGTGVIGLALAKAMPCGTVEVVQTDRDKLACAVSRHNAMANDLDPRGPQLTVADAGVGYAPVRALRPEPFDLIVSNVPAKVGAEGLGELLFGAGNLLRPGGSVAFVHVTPLEGTIDSLREGFAEFHGPLEVTDESVGKEHRAQVWTFREGLPDLAGGDALAPWRRDDAPTTLSFRGARAMPHSAVHDVEEFDSLHFRTPLLVQVAQQRVPPAPGVERICVLNPNHGFLAVLLAHRREPARIELAGRDTLSLAVARENAQAVLKAWGLADRVTVALAPPHRSLPWLPAGGRDEEAYHLVVGHPHWKEGKAALETTLRTLAATLTDEGGLVLSVGVGQVEGLKRAARRAGLQVARTDTRRKGHAALAMRRGADADADADADAEDGDSG